MALRLPFQAKTSALPPAPQPIRHLDLSDPGLPAAVVWLATHDLHGEPLPRAGMARIGPSAPAPRLLTTTTTTTTQPQIQELAS